MVIGDDLLLLRALGNPWTMIKVEVRSSRGARPEKIPPFNLPGYKATRFSFLPAGDPVPDVLPCGVDCQCWKLP